MQYISDFHFLRPLWLLAWLPTVLFMYWVMRYGKHKNQWSSVCDAHLLPYLLVRFYKAHRYESSILLMLGMSLMIVALAGPTNTRIQVPLYQQKGAHVIVLDLSVNMKAEDVTPSRLVRAKYKLLDLLKRSQETQTGLIVFSKEAYVVSPLTEDVATIKTFLPELSPDIMPVEGENIAVALNKAWDLLRQSGNTSGEVILITSAETVDQAALDAAAVLHAHNNRVSVLGIGTRAGAPIPLTSGGFLQDAEGAIVLSRLGSEGLRELAAKGGGQYATFTTNDDDINKLLVHAPRKKTSDLHQSSKTQAVWLDGGLYVVWFILIWVVLAVYRGWVHAWVG